jgi:hypothetical protein
MDYGLKHRSVGGAWGQKRTCRSENVTSALPPKADIAGEGVHGIAKFFGVDPSTVQSAALSRRDCVTRQNYEHGSKTSGARRPRNRPQSIAGESAAAATHPKLTC